MDHAYTCVNIYACHLIAGILLFFFCVYMEEDIRRNWSKLLYGGRHLDQQPSEPVYLKNDGIKILLLKKFLLITKSVATMLA